LPALSALRLFTVLVARLPNPSSPAVEFHKWYADLTEVLSSIISKKQPGAAGDVGVRATSARRRQQQESRGELRTNAFELISGCFNVSVRC
jgi:hypothetical protein